VTKAKKPVSLGQNLDDDDVFNAYFPERVWQAKANAFFSLHPVFRHEEFIEEYTGTGHTHNAARAALQFYVREGRIRNVRRLLYVVEDIVVDGLLYASRITADAVLAYGSAMTFHGYMLGQEVWPVVARLPAPVFRDGSFACRIVEKPEKRDREHGVSRALRNGVPVRVTSLERTLVDLLDRPDLGASMEELFEAFCTNDWDVDLSLMAGHAERIDSRVCAARLGLMLQTHPRHRGARTILKRLYRMRPTAAACAVPGIRNECFVQGRWNLVMPRAFFRRVEARSGEGWNDRMT
jgi:predicted transcriptional regulator of viral defense system